MDGVFGEKGGEMVFAFARRAPSRPRTGLGLMAGGITPEATQRRPRVAPVVARLFADAVEELGT